MLPNAGLAHRFLLIAGQISVVEITTEASQIMLRPITLALTLCLTMSSALPLLAVPQTEASRSECRIDLTRVGMMEDILSNALMLGLRRDSGRVQGFLKEARAGCESGDELLAKTAVAFKIPQPKLRALVERFRHVNCNHGATAAASPESGKAPRPALTAFARDVTLHVVLHELGHALVREFDLPILANEETLADAFATHYLVRHLPRRAHDVLSARVASLMLEAGEVARSEWKMSGEHNHDARRAYQIAALAIAFDSQKYGSLGKLVGMSKRDQSKAVDYGAEIHRSWRRTLKPLWMPEGRASNEARVRVQLEAPLAEGVVASGLTKEIEAVVVRFDWHSQVTVRLVDGDGGAGWSRSKRTITVNSAYVERFIRQGQAIANAK